MKEYFVYILLCGDDSYYTGITNNIERRLWEHETSVNLESYTSKRLPVKLVFCQKFQRPDLAIAFEKQLKGWSRKKKQALIEGNREKLKELSICMNDSHHKNFRKSPFGSAQGDTETNQGKLS